MCPCWWKMKYRPPNKMQMADNISASVRLSPLLGHANVFSKMFKYTSKAFLTHRFSRHLVGLCASRHFTTWKKIGVQCSTRQSHTCWRMYRMCSFCYSWCSTYGSHLTILLIFFLFVWIKYLTFYISKVLFLRSLNSGTIFTRTFQYGLRVPFWNQKLHFRFTCFYLLAPLNGSFKTSFISLKNINLII